ncbi:MAG: hypothetical protein LUD50_02965 [Clostridia bacterium]|nr:hypothetical protein [Clostridia bacterium]
MTAEEKQEKSLQRIRRAGEKQKLKDELKAEREKYWPKKKRNYSKLALAYILLSATAVQIYSMAAMWYYMDLSALYSLIGATVGEAISFCAYEAKSAKENSAGGIIHDTAMMQAAGTDEEPQG